MELLTLIDVTRMLMYRMHTWISDITNLLGFAGYDNINSDMLLFEFLLKFMYGYSENI